jgi:replicative DNA helicase
MSNASLLRRYIASRASVALHRVRSGHMDQDQRQNAQAALFDATENPNLRMADKLFTVPAIRAALSRMAAREKIDLIVIDYLQLLTTGNARQSLTEEVTQISRAVKLLAVEFGCPVLIGSQLSRESEKEGREPRLSDLRNSGSLEQDADTVIFPHPSKIQDTESVDLRVEFIVAKQRDGRIGRVPMTFERPYVRFSEL